MRPAGMQTDLPTCAVTPNETMLCASLELSHKTWLLTVLSPGTQRMSRFSSPAGIGDAFTELLDRLRSKADVPEIQIPRPHVTIEFDNDPCHLSLIRGRRRRIRLGEGPSELRRPAQDGLVADGDARAASSASAILVIEAGARPGLPPPPGRS
jgi:hypothetical protein